MDYIIKYCSIFEEIQEALQFNKDGNVLHCIIVADNIEFPTNVEVLIPQHIMYAKESDEYLNGLLEDFKGDVIFV